MTICCIPKLFPHTEVKERIKKKKTQAIEDW